MDFHRRSPWEICRWVIPGFPPARAKAWFRRKLSRKYHRTSALAGGPYVCIHRGLRCYLSGTSGHFPESTGDSRPHRNQALLVSTLRNASRGQTTLETLKPWGDQEVRRYICMPSNRPDGSEPVVGEVFAVGWNERIYDIGFVENWRAVLTKGRYK